MRPFPFVSEFLFHYIPAIFSIALTTAVLHVLRQILDTPLIALLYLLPVGLSASYWGLGAGVIAALAAFLTFNYFFIEPVFTLAVHSPSDLVVLVLFLVVAVVISQLVGRARSGQAAATAREFEATHLYELSISLTGYLDPQSIIRIVCEQIQGILDNEALEFLASNPETLMLKLPAGGPSPDRQPDLTIPLQAGADGLGKIRLWRKTPISQAENRLLKTFASQAALALERAHLSEADSRAKVLEESDRLKSALLSSVSHELRTPLATIKAAATSLRSGEVSWDSKAREDLLGAVEDEADHLNLLVGNLLNMSRIEANQLRPERQWNLLSEIVGSVLARLKHTPADHEVEVDIPEDMPLLPVDFVQMEQVFTNLINNSFKYAPAGTTVRISARVEQDSTVRVQVANQGPPVPTQDLERIFDKFHRITSADRVTGTGLGLSICKGIIEAHEGHIWAENLPSGFAINFTLSLLMDGKLAPPPPIESEP